MKTSNQVLLSKITDLISLLTAEIELHKQQYEYYRDRLLTFDDSVGWKTLGEIATITQGKRFIKNDLQSIGFPCVHYGQIHAHYALYADQVLSFINPQVAQRQRMAQPMDIIMAITSENLRDAGKSVAWLGKGEIAIGDHTAIIHHAQNPKYLVHYFHTPMFATQKKKWVQGVKVIEILPRNLENVKIPIPSLEEQDRIVAMLDPLYLAWTRLNACLEAEIELLKKQHEYYQTELKK